MRGITVSRTMEALRRTHDISHIRADPGLIYKLASEIEHWPKLLPHYRRVRVLGNLPEGRLVEMAARRGCIPVSWRSIQHLRPDDLRILYHHTGGPTRGMDVEWIIEPGDGGVVRVEIVHELTFSVPIVRSSLGKHVIATVFISHIANQTLRCIQEIAERGYRQ